MTTPSFGDFIAAIVIVAAAIGLFFVLSNDGTKTICREPLTIKSTISPSN